MTNEFIQDPDLYKRMSEPRPPEEAMDAYVAFFKAVSEARERYRIRDVVLVSTVAIKDGGQGHGAMLVGYRGDEALVISLLAQALGQMREKLDKELDALAGGNKQRKKAK